MPVSMNVDIRGNKQLADTLEKIEQATGKREPIHKLFGIAMLRWVDQNFRKQGSPAWKPLSPNTIAGRRKGKGKGGPKILQDTGVLKGSFSYDYSGSEAVVGSPLEYAAYHEEGKQGPWTIRAKRKKALMFQTPNGPIFRKSVQHPGIPQRKMLPTEEQLFDEVKPVEIAQRYLEKVINSG